MLNDKHISVKSATGGLDGQTTSQIGYASRRAHLSNERRVTGTKSACCQQLGSPPGSHTSNKHRSCKILEECGKVLVGAEAWYTLKRDYPAHGAPALENFDVQPITKSDHSGQKESSILSKLVHSPGGDKSSECCKHHSQHQEHAVPVHRGQVVSQPRGAQHMST